MRKEPITPVSHGVVIGTALAVVMSWTANKSILWAILHGLLNWFYVIYRALGFGSPA